MPLASATLPVHLELQIFDQVFRRRKNLMAPMIYSVALRELIHKIN